MSGSNAEFDPQRIAATASYIRDEVEAGGQEKLLVALRVGAHILKTFFGGSALAFTDKGRSSPSLRALLEHPTIESLGLSHRTLAYYVSVAIQDDQWDSLIAKGQLAPDAKRLGYTKRVRLLPTKRTTDLVRIVKDAVEQDLGPSEIAALVKEANASAPKKARRREADEVAAAKKAVAAGRRLLEADWTEIDDEDLLTASTLVDAAATATGTARDKIDGEREARGLQAPTVATGVAADTPDELDDLMKDLTGEDLGLGAALRDDAVDAIRHHGERIIAGLAWADEDALKQWFVPFAVEIAQQLGAEGDLVKACGGKTPRQRRGRTWFLVQAHDEIPTEDFTFDAFVEGTHSPRMEAKCIVQAADEDDAVNRFVQGVGDLDPDVEAEHRVLVAEPLKKIIRGKTIKAYLAKPRNERRPMLREYIDELTPD